jgi:hypothetical protein
MLREDIVSPDYRPLAVTAAAWMAGTAQLTVGPHGLAKDWVITVAGMNSTDFNGTWTITSVTATTVSFTLSADPGSFVSGGTLSTGGPENRPSSAMIQGFGGLDTAADRLRLQTFCLTCHLEQSSTHNDGKLCTECHSHGPTSSREF